MKYINYNEIIRWYRCKTVTITLIQYTGDARVLHLSSTMCIEFILCIEFRLQIKQYWQCKTQDITLIHTNNINNKESNGNKSITVITMHIKVLLCIDNNKCMLRTTDLIVAIVHNGSADNSACWLWLWIVCCSQISDNVDAIYKKNSCNKNVQQLYNIMYYSCILLHRIFSNFVILGHYCQDACTF